MPVRLVAQEEPLPGYRLIERLGRGGFGEVWKVEAPGGLHKAMKFVFGDLDAADEASRPAEQELKALRRVQDIRHPYVLSLERYDIKEGQLIIVMELADRNLWDRFRECRSQGLPGIPRDELLRYAEETAEALDLMNNYYQIQHLDIKPQNLFLVFNHVKVGDFGLAKLLEGVRATVTGGVTPVYAAPETFEGWVSRYSDQYSLGIVFQELLTGTRPFNGANTRQLLMQHLNGTPDLSALPAADRPIIARALSKKPEDRWASCSDLVRSLRAAGSPVDLLPAPDTPRPEQSPADSVAVTRPQGQVRRPTPPEDPGRTQIPRPPLDSPLRQQPGSRPVGGSTPMPPLVTVGPAGAIAPRLVTPAAASGGVPNPAVTLQRPLVVQTGRMGSLGIAPPEKTGDGTLFPALVVGVGQTGRRVVERLKRAITDRYPGPDAVPHVRFLVIDTDPDAAAVNPDDPGGLNPREVVLTRLQRPAHYLQRDSLPPVEPWMPPGLLYKLARTPGPAAGVRAYGRLALIDNYRLVAQRLRQEVETFLSDDSLAAADKTTGLGLRTNRPRVYVVAGLAGGTGGGMFLDLAYLIRHELRAVGYMRPEVIGVLFVPPADPKAGRAGLGNAHAALTELYHFQARRSRYQVAFDKSEAPVVDSDPPFARTVVLQLPRTPTPARQAEAAGLAARVLYQEVLTPAGRVTDEAREAARTPAPGPTAQAVGLFRLIWPRPEMLAAATRRFAQRLLQQWMAKDAAHLREPIAAWLGQQWSEKKLRYETVSGTFQAAVRDALREEPEKVFDAFVDPLQVRTPSGGRLDPAAAAAVLEQLVKLVGKPNCEDADGRGSLLRVLAGRFPEVVKEAEGQLAFMAVSFIEQPQYRLAGAEEAVAQIGQRLRQQINALEPTLAGLDREVRGMYDRLTQLIGGRGGPAGLNPLGVFRGSATAELLDLLRAYPRKQLHLLVVDTVLAVYRKLLGNTPEYLREINYCRASLGDLHAALAQTGGPADAADAAGPGKLILPTGCNDLDAAADLFLAGLDPQEILAFDQAFQRETRKKFRGLANICLKAAAKGALFRELLLARARAFLDAKLDRTDPATGFFRARGEQEADPLVSEAYEQAAPGVVGRSGPPPQEIAVLAAPLGAEGVKFRATVAAVLPGVDLITAPLDDDIVFYREYPELDLADLPQFGDTGKDASAQMAAAEHPPHARSDVPWQPPGPPPPPADDPPD